MVLTSSAYAANWSFGFYITFVNYRNIDSILAAIYTVEFISDMHVYILHIHVLTIEINALIAVILINSIQSKS